MQILPVFATVAASYRFLVRELPTIVRLTWAPLAIAAIVQYLVARHVLNGMAAALAAGDATAGVPSGAHVAGIGVRACVELIATAIVAVPLHELVLFRERKPGAYFHVNFGPLELRFVLLALVFGAATFGVVLMSLSASDRTPMGYAPVAATITLIVALYVSLRLWPIFPIIVVKNRFDFREAWALTRGRFWSMLALGIVGMLPLILIAVVLTYPLPDFESVASAPNILAEKRLMVDAAQAWLPLRSAVDFVISILNTAIGVALISYAYKALTGHAFEETLPSPVAAR